MLTWAASDAESFRQIRQGSDRLAHYFVALPRPPVEFAIQFQGTYIPLVFRSLGFRVGSRIPLYTEGSLPQSERDAIGFSMFVKLWWQLLPNSVIFFSCQYHLNDFLHPILLRFLSVISLDASEPLEFRPGDEIRDPVVRKTGTGT